MKINGPYTVRGPQAGQRGGKTGSAKPGAFARLLEGEDAVASVPGAAPVPPVGAVLAVQEIGDEESARRKAKARASRMLDRLDELRLGLLTGILPKEGIAELIELVRSERPVVSDPQMAEALEAIELRAQVELAKLEMRQGKQEDRGGHLDQQG